MADPVIGDCALCGSMGVELQDSHVIPRWAYTRMRGKDPKSAEPIMISGGRALHTGQQVSEHMLCKPCEQLLGVSDKVASQLSYKDNAAPLLADVTLDGPPEDGCQVAVLAPTIDRDQLCRFAAATFWRGHVAKAIPDCRIGDRYAAELREYLHAGGRFPSQLSIVLMVHVSGAKGKNHLGQALLIPATHRARGYFLSEFIVCGLHFYMAAGHARPEGFKAACLNGAPAPFIILSEYDSAQSGFLQLIADTKAKGKLAKAHPSRA